MRGPHWPGSPLRSEIAKLSYIQIRRPKSEEKIKVGDGWLLVPTSGALP